LFQANNSHETTKTNSKEYKPSHLDLKMNRSWKYKGLYLNSFYYKESTKEHTHQNAINYAIDAKYKETNSYSMSLK